MPVTVTGMPSTLGEANGARGAATADSVQKTLERRTMAWARPPPQNVGPRKSFDGPERGARTYNNVSQC